MKSPLYVLTALLPLALAIPSPEADVGAESLEERGNGNDKNNNWDGKNNNWDGKNNDWDGKNNNWDRCSKNWPIDYYQFPCDGSDKKGSYDSNKHVDYKCKYKNYYKTGDGWWVKESDKPNGCNDGNWNCF